MMYKLLFVVKKILLALIVSLISLDIQSRELLVDKDSDLNAIFGATKTRYIIQYNHDLGSNTVKNPKGYVIDLQGYSVKNGTLIFDNTLIEASIGGALLCNTKETIANDKVNIKLFGARDDGKIDDIRCNSACNLCDA